MEKLNPFQENNLRSLLELAKKLNERRFFETFLNDAQFKIVDYILSLDQVEVWSQFLEGNCYVQYKYLDKIEKPVLNAILEDGVDDDEEEEEEEEAAAGGKEERVNKGVGIGGKLRKQDSVADAKSNTKIKQENGNKRTGNVKTDEAQRAEENIELSFDEGIKMSKKLALHIRYLLWEKAIDFYYDTQELNQNETGVGMSIKEVSDDYELMDSMQYETAEHKNEPPKVDATKNVREVEDDYDDYDDEDDEDEKQEVDKNKKDNGDGNKGLDEENHFNFTQSSQDNELEYNEKKQLVLKVPVLIFENATNTGQTDKGTFLPQLPSYSSSVSSFPATSAAAAAAAATSSSSSSSSATTTAMHTEDKKADQDNLIKEFNKVYHNFEYDRETLFKRRKLEQSDLRLEKKDEKNGNSATHAMNIALGLTSTSLQHLLSTIHSKRNKVALNDHELRNLFMDVRKNRGKWANDDRVGQEELYEACEKVVTELRNYTEHSTFFLNKVSKREAPNYGLIIKKPMDLNTVMKKLKNLLYNSKKEFVDDLMLIWSNCLTYNADPKHFIRAHAIAMQKKTQKLAPTIPDITIKTRAELEKEEEAEAEAEKKGGTTGSVERATEQDNDDDASGSSSGKHTSKKGRKRTRQDEVKTEEVKNQDPNGTSSSTPNIGNGTPVEEKPNGVHEAEEEDEEEDENMASSSGAMAGAGGAENEEDEFDPELQAWKTLTSKSRANYCEQRSKLFNEKGYLRSEAPAIIRKSDEMAHFNEYLSNEEVISKAKSLLENDEPYMMEYDVSGGVPGFAYSGVTEEQEEASENKLVDIYLQQTGGDASKIKSDFTLLQDSGLNKLYVENITEIQEIRKICFKISLIRQMQTQQFVHHTQMKQPEIEHIKEVDTDAASKLPNHDPYTHEIQYCVLRRNVAKIAMQTGFETAAPSAINTLAQIAEKYIGNIAKSLKLHTETNSRNRLNDPQEVLLLSLLENGVDKPDDLYTFIQERVMKQQDKLKDLRVKLSNFLKDLLRPGLENFNEKSFADNSEQFMTGDFSNDLGDDFFGFKELGLDKEYNMLTSSIPIHLLHSRLHNQFSSTGGANKRHKFEDLQEYEPEKLHASDVEKQIGLLKPFYSKLNERSKQQFIKLQKKKGESLDLPDDNLFVLIEDEELPQKQRNIRPKLPPTGKITAIKKKIIANSFFLKEEDELPKLEPIPVAGKQAVPKTSDAEKSNQKGDKVNDSSKESNDEGAKKTDSEEKSKENKDIAMNGTADEKSLSIEKDAKIIDSEQVKGSKDETKDEGKNKEPSIDGGKEDGPSKDEGKAEESSKDEDKGEDSSKDEGKAEESSKVEGKAEDSSKDEGEAEETLNNEAKKEIVDEDAGKYPTSGHKKDVSDENTVNVENVENDDVDVEMKDTEDKKDTASVPPEAPNKALDTADLDSNRDIAHED